MTETVDLESQQILHSSKTDEKDLPDGGSMPGPAHQNENFDSTSNDAEQNDHYPDQKMSDEPLYSPDEIASAWEKCHGVIKDRDIAMCKAWREEIQQLLIFAGLFSATITAFIIESYKWLQPESNDVTAQYLGFLAAQFAHAQNVTLPETLSRLNTPPNVTSSAIRINIFWFLSLIFNLSVVLIGILGYQWLREFQEEAPNLSHKEAIMLHQRKFQGIQFWHVPGIISTLPMLLQLALVLFFGGILDLLWHRSPVVAAVATVAVGAVILFLVITTAAPALQSMCYRFRLYQHLMRGPLAPCPFKSTQFWIVLRFTLWIQGIIQRIAFLITKEEGGSRVDVFFDWSTYDLDWRWRSFEERAIHDAIKWMYCTWSYNTDILDMLGRCLADLNIYDAEALVYKLIPRDYSAQEAVRHGLLGFRSKGKRHAIMSIWLLEPHIDFHPTMQTRWVNMVLQTYGSDPTAYEHSGSRLWSKILQLLVFGEFDRETMIQTINSLCVRCEEYPNTVDGRQLYCAWQILRKLSWNTDNAHNAFWADVLSKEVDMDHLRFTCRVSKSLLTALRSKMEASLLANCASALTYFWALVDQDAQFLKLSRTFPEFVNIINLVEFLRQAIDTRASISSRANIGVI